MAHHAYNTRTRLSSAYHLVDSITFFAKPRQKDASFLREKYLVEELSTQQIADICFSSRSTIVRHLKLNRIALREIDVARNLRAAQIPYGQKLLHGNLVPCRSELLMIEKMLRLRNKGFSYQRISELLNNWETPTKNKDSRWHATTVMKILNAHSNAGR
ncbi:hypothetical protein AZI86_07210 [Bdellovibrio bacteriovorus]|uniref:Recombinase domain-containing protein n=1 Tax=Bdellovibrio bacteriovorus TaxID=959 RepID=A0A150WR89_BDEBC|nr:hypothetical protein AZI86_07210 [Bdellovibrio bacteriovorus]